MKKFLNIILILILVIILFVNSVILISSCLNPDKVPSFFGWKPFITLSGSMESEIYAGDLAVVKEIDTKDLKVGDVIAFKLDDIVITHRIQKIDINENGIKYYITKGDNNDVEDVTPVYDNMIEGKLQFKIAKLGNIAIFIQTPLGMLTVIGIPLILLILIQATKNRKDAISEENMKKELEKLKEENKKLSEKV